MMSTGETHDDQPRSMRHVGVREHRRTMLYKPHIAPLTEYAAKLRKRGSVEVPEFDPFDGGVHAQVLFLFEKPGPMTAGNGGSGFISRNNDDPSAEATFRFMQNAEIPRQLTVTWNVIPWWNGTRKVTGQELREGVECVRELILLLPILRSVVLVGKNAARANAYLNETGLTLFTSAHPSPLVRAKYPEKWNAIPSQWAKVQTVLTKSGAPHLDSE
ncbi:uracil-DNA glycosylase [Tunturiibacter gelidoferens]|uniref:Uracil-DNA glycosylase n=1 Tax=Tunturiibacter gelidiferens TaxID=3069689 RepID=A0ACC5NXK2_9BACT|nr:uracil-DNA glycosylase [Edaphobacter lichenicola]MBB5339312.1 uracil-DNA glycosylase [Edaphobacter lichenicola]